MEKLYNGIVLPDGWLQNAQPPSGIMEEIPYLQTPPEVIDVTVGRQLFVDTFLIEETDLQTTYHKAKKHPQNPVFKAEKPWEMEPVPVACPKSGGVWYDEEEKLYRMWYEAGWLRKLAYAQSKDGIHWERPELDTVPGTNIIFHTPELLSIQNAAGEQEQVRGADLRTDSTSFIIDREAPKQERFKMFLRGPSPATSLYDRAIIGTSGDGIHWENLHYTGELGDRSTAFYNPFRRKWVFSMRDYWKSRSRRYFETDDFLRANWDRESVTKWLARDAQDTENPYTDKHISLYNTDVVAYESILLGMFQVWYGPDNLDCLKTGRPKYTELIPMYSRDGFHFARPSRDSIIKCQEESWDWGYIQSVTGGLIVKEDELWLYYVGFAGDESIITDDEIDNGMYANGATGIAVLRRDGFVSVGTEEEGTLLTRLLTAEDTRHLFINAEGTVSAQILWEGGSVSSETVSINSTKKELTFPGFDLGKLRGKTFRIRFTLKNAQLYSFWFSGSETGESGGYLGAGAPKG